MSVHSFYLDSEPRFVRLYTFKIGWRPRGPGSAELLTARGITHSFAGHPAMSGLFFNPQPPSNYREWLNSDYEFYDAVAEELHEPGILVEPDSREPWFLCAAHDMKCVEETLDKFAGAVDITMAKSPQERGKVKTSYVQ